MCKGNGAGSELLGAVSGQNEHAVQAYYPVASRICAPLPSPVDHSSSLRSNLHWPCRMVSSHWKMVEVMAISRSNAVAMSAEETWPHEMFLQVALLLVPRIVRVLLKAS